jgi:C4-dicarboxylate transporter DctM subunit
MAVLFHFLMVIALMLIGVPIAVSLGLSSIVFLMMHSDPSLASVAHAGHYTLLAIPFVMACMMFAALSDSSPATVVAIGSIVIAGMVKNGYSKGFAAGVICNAGTLGILIPPSIVMVVYAAATDVSVARMFLGGVIPGLLAGAMLMFAIYIAARVKNLPKQPFVGWGELMSAGRDAIWGLFLIVIILGGIYGGIFTPTEAAAVASVYAFLIANFVYKDMGPFDAPENRLPGVVKVFQAFVHPDTKKTLCDAGRLTIMLLFIIANALILKHVLTEEQVPQMIANSMLFAGLGPITLLFAGLGPITFLIVLNLLLLIGGQFMEPSGLLIIVAPLVFPIAIQLGIDSIHLGIHYGGEYGDWDDNAACRSEPVCDSRSGPHVDAQRC